MSLLFPLACALFQDLDDATVRENFFLDGVGLTADSKAGLNSLE